MALNQQQLVGLLQQAMREQQAGNAAAAEKTCRHIISLVPGEPNALQFLGLLCAGRGDEASGEQYMRESLASAPNQPHVLSNLGNLLNRTGRREEALEAYGKAVALKPDYVQAWQNYGSVLLEMERFESVVQVMGDAVSKGARSPAIYNLLGMAHRQQEDFDDAFSAFQAALSLDPN